VIRGLKPVSHAELKKNSSGVCRSLWCAGKKRKRNEVYIYMCVCVCAWLVIFVSINGVYFCMKRRTSKAWL
jgi:hypothetical protein